MELKRVVVTGMGALTPLGNNIPDYWNGLINGISGADMITLFDASKFRTKFACEIKGFEPTAFLDKKDVKNTVIYPTESQMAKLEFTADIGANLKLYDAVWTKIKAR